MAVQMRDLIGKQFRFESKNYPNHFIRHQNWKVFKHENDPSKLYQLDSSFDVIPGVAGQGISLRSVNYPAYYIRHYEGECFIHSSDVEGSFKKDASWTLCPGLADPKGVSFESVNFPGQFLRHCNDVIRKDINSNTPLFLEDATWYPRLADDQQEITDGAKENLQQSTNQIERPQQSVPDDNVMDSLKLKAALAREKELQQKLEEANQMAKKEKEEAEKRIKAAEEKKADNQQETFHGVPQETEPLRITQHPSDKTKHCKQGTMVAVRAGGGSGTLTYQWLKDGENFSEDSLPTCMGVTSDTLKFLSLAPEHSGTYMCRVSDERACIIESKPAVLRVVSMMKIREFLNEKAERQDPLLIIRDGLIQKFRVFLQESGCTCVDDLNTIMEDIEAHATVTCDNAMIDFTTQRVETKISYLEFRKLQSREFINDSDSKDRRYTFKENVVYTLGSETSKTKVKGWSLNGSLVGGYEGVQAGVGATYGSQTVKTQQAFQSVERTENFEELIVVPRKSRVKVAIEKRIEIFMCDVNDLIVTFSAKKSSIRCRVEKKEKKTAKAINKTFQLKDVFASCTDHSHHHHGKQLTVRLNGKCTWTETSVRVQCHDPEPLQIKK